MCHMVCAIVLVLTSSWPDFSAILWRWCRSARRKQANGQAGDGDKDGAELMNVASTFLSFVDEQTLK